MRFCPYCGKQIGERSKFCSQCGKATPQRHRSAALAIEEAPAVTNAPRSEARDKPRVTTASRSANLSSGDVIDRRTRPLAATARPANGSPAARRYAPPTHSLIDVFEQAGFGLRYGAWMFDFLITLIGIMSFTFIVTAVSKRSVVGSNLDLVIVAVLTLLLVILNFVVLAGTNGQSAGMRILGIRIARVDGKPFTIKDAAMRHLLGYPLSMAAFFLGFLWMLWDPRQQGWHDKLAHTIVVMSR